jgi:major vault protein
MSSEEKNSRDLVLAPNEYMYIQDVTKGQIKTLVGPTVCNPSPQEKPVVYDPGAARFRKVDRLEEAVRIKAIAVEGYYLVLKNPAKGEQLPAEGTTNAQAPDLDVGRKVNIPGPTMFALWPGQAAEHVKGHNLRSNQYLIGRVYNEEEAKKNWRHAVIKPATGTEGSTEGSSDKLPDEVTAVTIAPPEDLSVGREFVIKGTDVSFYMPPTGVSVVPVNPGSDVYVREAVTLERLEYAVLIDQNGTKRFEVGPQVVFPSPTETFRVDKNNHRKFKAVELNGLQGLHIKVVAPYKEEDGTERVVGQELFITGEDTAIYFPREEHFIVEYDGNKKHFAVQIPAGEARYVMNRFTGEIRTVTGPTMLLPDPRKEVLVRRVLSDKQCERWYPGNEEALAYNRLLREIQTTSPTTRAGTVSEGDVARGYKRVVMQQRNLASKGGAYYASSQVGEAMMDRSQLTRNQDIAADAFTRGADYTEPRSITPVTKFKGVPSIEVWTGYAVKVVSKRGQRRVEIGPQNLLLDYDESLEVLELSTGKPKTTDKLLKTVYLRVANNKISDIAEVETQDHVNVRLKLSLRVGFEGDPEKWFDVENYVKYLCDHVRSVLKGVVRRMPVEEFYEGAVDIVRDTILGKSEGEGVDRRRSGMVFSENGMRVTDVEVLTVKIADDRVAALLQQAQHDVVQGHITVRQEEQNLSIIRRREELRRERLSAEHTSKVHGLDLDAKAIAKALEVDSAKLAADKKRQDDRKLVVEAEQLVKDVAHKAELDRHGETEEQRLAFVAKDQALALERLAAETATAVERMKSVQPGFVEALTALGDKSVMIEVAKAWDYQHMLGGKSLPESISKVFHGTPISRIVDRIANGNGVSATTPAVPSTPPTPTPRA